MPTGNPGEKRKPLSKKTKRKISKANKGKKRTDESKLKMSLAQKRLYENGYVSPMLKERPKSKVTIHSWIERKKGKPTKCEHCGTEDKSKTYDWANIDHKYKRDENEFIRLCRSCHRKYDIKYNEWNRWKKRA